MLYRYFIFSAFHLLFIFLHYFNLLNLFATFDHKVAGLRTFAVFNACSSAVRCGAGRCFVVDIFFLLFVIVVIVVAYSKSRSFTTVI